MVWMRTLGPYEIVEKIGEGGMGVVWKARDPRLERFVALKQLHATKLSDSGRSAGFLHEARAASALNHPNIITIYDISSEAGDEYIVMEFVEGRTLSDLIASGGLSQADALRYAAQVADALDKAHSAGIVHRDLKPGNILFAADGTPKIADFSIAKLLNGRGDETETGAIMGTACYMAPEQAWGRSRRVTPAADTYSLGVLLYQALAGQPPFRGESFLQTLAQVRDAAPVPPSLRQPGVPEELDDICLKCLRKEPAKRFRSALALAEELRRFRESV
jgi:eukaryotic-like serine/threonine-protein kinase